MKGFEWSLKFRSKSSSIQMKKINFYILTCFDWLEGEWDWVLWFKYRLISEFVRKLHMLLILKIYEKWSFYFGLIVYKYFPIHFWSCLHQQKRSFHDLSQDYNLFPTPIIPNNSHENVSSTDSYMYGQLNMLF